MRVDHDKLNEIEDILAGFVLKITERCKDVYPNKWEGVAKDILYNHNMDWVEGDTVLTELVHQMKSFEDSAAPINPYLKYIDENS